SDAASASSQKNRVKEDKSTVQVFAPAVTASTDAKPKRVAKKLETAEVDNGWSGISNPETAKQIRTKIKSEPQAQAPAAIVEKEKSNQLKESAAQNATAREKQNQAQTGKQPSQTPAQEPA